MDLISRKAVKEEIKDEWDGSCSEYGPKQIINDTLCAVDRIPTVPAVPLDKLCEWLQENASLTHGTLISAAGWKYELTRWMEEQDAQKEN
jgi:hypothetical protein